MSKNTARIIAGFVVFAMLASVVALIAVAAFGNNDTTPQPVNVNAQAAEQDQTQQQDQSQQQDLDVQPVELPATGPSGLPSVSVASLPVEATETLLLIDSDGPYPYDKDGSTFQNREGILPDADVGYYAEFTVDTPGLDHRGARRIVTGSTGEIYWTDDHYESFSEILDWSTR